MYCPSCQSSNQAEFTAEMIIHFSASRTSISPEFGCSRRFRSAWIAALRVLPPRKPNWRCWQAALRQVQPQPGVRVLPTVALGPRIDLAG
jgi:hypothetical protein